MICELNYSWRKREGFISFRKYIKFCCYVMFVIGISINVGKECFVCFFWRCYKGSSNSFERFSRRVSSYFWDFLRLVIMEILYSFY